MPGGDQRTSIDTTRRGSVSFPPPEPSTRDATPSKRGDDAPRVVGPGRPAVASPIQILGGAREDVNQFPIQLAKVQRPSLRPETLRRDRLLDWLHAKIHSRVVLLTAEAGYGKTTLLADFSRRTRMRTLWYRLDEQDRDWVRVMHHLVAAGRVLDGGFAPATGGLLQEMGPGGPDRDAIIDTFIRELFELGIEGAVVIIDDYHVVDESAEIRHVMRQLIARAPERMTFVFAGRRHPSIPLARLRALGEVVELTAQDLRFDGSETEQLFRETYGRPLEPDVLAELRSRTEGWAASLQLVQTALGDRSSGDIRTFVRGLTGTQGDLYDYLAEEVVGEQDARMQEFLMRTSILQVVDQERVGVVTALDQDAAQACIELAERLGLLSRHGAAAHHVHRYHPLVRDFLEDRLRREIGATGVIELHRQVATWADGRDWRLAAYHYGAAGDLTDVHRVLTSAIQIIMSTGEYELAEALIDAYPPAEPQAAYEVVRSRMDLLRGDLDLAVGHAKWAYENARSLSSLEREATQMNWMAMAATAGDEDEAARAAREMGASRSDRAWPNIARALLLVLGGSVEGGLDAAAQLLRRMARQQSADRQTHFLGITQLNLGNVLRNQSRPLDAKEAAEESVESLSRSSKGHEIASAKQLHAWAVAALGDFSAAQAELQEATSTGHVLERGEGLVEWAELHVWFGDAGRASELLEEARPYVEPYAAYFDWWRVVAAFAYVRVGDLDAAEDMIASSPLDRMTLQTALKARKLAALAGIAVLRNDPRAGALVDDALELSRRQGAHLWESFVHAVNLAALPSPSSQLLVLLDTEPWSVSMAADWVVHCLARIDDRTLERLRAEARLRPDRWRSALRPLLDDLGPTSLVAAPLLDEIGTIEDVPRLRLFARRGRAKGVSPSLGKGLARHLAHRVFVEDQGRVRITLGDRRVAGSDVRRKVLALLCFLISRPGFSATRDAVLEAMWPDLEPDVAVNSLNQTVYFLRRVFEERYNEDLSPGYVHHDFRRPVARSGPCRQPERPLQATASLDGPASRPGLSSRA